MPTQRLFPVALALAVTASVAYHSRVAAQTPVPIRHVANIPYSSGTDVEFATKVVEIAPGVREERDYAFAGRIGAPVAVIDVTDPEHPVKVAEVPCSLNQNDVQVAGDILVMAADATGRCTKPDGTQFDVLGFATADISDPRSPAVLGVARVPLGGHNTTVHPTQPLVYVSNGGSNVARIHIWDITNPAAPTRVQDWQYSQLDSPHDITFNAGGTRAYAASINHTDIIDTTDPRNPVLISSIVDPAIYISHQADPTPDGKYLIISDEVGGGTFPVCPGGGLHLYDISNEAQPLKTGMFFADTVGVQGISCTSHVFRLNPDGHTLAIGWYNAGVHVVDLRDFHGVAIGGSGAITGIGGRTIAIADLFVADVWAAKMWQERHPGYVFVNDLRRGFDVFHVPELAD